MTTSADPQPRLVGRPGHNAGKRFPPQILTRDEAQALVRSSSPRSPTGARNRAIIVLLLRSGLRLAEALALVPADVDVNEGSIRVLHGKGDRSRVVGVDPGAAAVISAWIARRQALGIGPRRRLFCTLDGQPLHPQYVRAMIARLGERAGIAKRVHPHGLRHTHASQLADELWPLNRIQLQLGHSNLATTSRYVAHINPTELLAAARAREWTP